jgi:hypothetical protein
LQRLIWTSNFKGKIMYPHTDIPLRAMPLLTKADAVAFVGAYKAWIIANSATGNGAFIGARSVPATVRAPDLVRKAHEAYELAGMNYWQMSYKQAKRFYDGLPLRNWERARLARGMNTSADEEQDAGTAGKRHLPNACGVEHVQG